MPDSKPRAHSVVTTTPSEVQTVAIPNPPAGGELTVTVPENEIWRVHTFRMKMITDSTTATRTIQLQFEFPGGQEMALVEASGQDADTTFWFQASVWGFDPADIDNRLRETLPQRFYLLPGSVVKTVTENIQTGDQFSDATFFVEKFSSNPTE